jgi:hypothetical protein
MWKLETIEESQGKIWKHRVSDDNSELNFDQVIELWQHEPAFNEWFIDRLLKVPAVAIRWETPALTRDSLKQTFEYVAVSSPGLDRTANPSAFANQFEPASGREVLAFENLGRNAIMIVPTPSKTSNDFCHLLSFLRNADRPQAVELFQVVGQQLKKRVGRKPVWLSTAGGGVAWLHVRLDDRPKYYSYSLYREVT